MSDQVQDKAALLEREGRVVELVNEGYTMAEVAEQVGYSNAGAVSKAYWRAVKRYPAKQVDSHRQNENIKLDALEANAEQIETDAINSADLELALKAQDRRLKIMDRRAKLNGLDRPMQIETTGDSIQRVILDPRVLGISPGGDDA